jgi:hypothetical protein
MPAHAESDVSAAESVASDTTEGGAAAPSKAEAEGGPRKVKKKKRRKLAHAKSGVGEVCPSEEQAATLRPLETKKKARKPRSAQYKGKRAGRLANHFGTPKKHQK